MTYICPECGQLKWDFEDFRYSAPKCAVCKVNMIPSADDAMEAKCIIPMPEDDVYVVCN